MPSGLRSECRRNCRRSVRRLESLHQGYQPIVTSRWSVGGLSLEQIAFCDLPDADAVVTGTEKQDLIVRVSVANNSDAPAAAALVLLPGIAHGSQLNGVGYGPFYAPVARWQQKEVQTNGAPSMKVEAAPGALLINGRVLLVYRAGAPMAAKFQPNLEVLDANSQKPVPVTNGLCFDLRLPTEGNPADRPRRLRKFQALSQVGAGTPDEGDVRRALQRAEAHWDRALDSGMKLTTPEPRLNNMYKQMILSTVSNFIKNPDTTWTTPEHCPMWPNAIWPWEFSAVSVALDSLGYHKDVRPCLQYFVEHQSGVGKFGKDVPPDGDVSSYRGAFVGYLRWMNETGSVLSIFANHYRYSATPSG